MNLGPMELLIIIGVGVACAIPTGIIAQKKGYSFVAFAVLGFFLTLIGLIIAAVLPDKSNDSINKDASVAEALTNYKKLLDEGVITQSEFDEKKRRLLEQ